MNDPRTDLLTRWRDLLARTPHTPRARDGAAVLGASEGALTEARRLADEAVPLALPSGVVPFLERLGGLGTLMALTRNDACVHEKKGVYAAPSVYGRMAQTLGEIDLRLFLDHWHAIYALTETFSDTVRRSFQIFDASGEAVHKIYAVEGTDTGAFDALAHDFAAADAPQTIFAPPPPPETERPNEAIDIAGFRAGWAALEHSHDFFPLLRRFGVTRAQAMRLGEPDFVRPVATVSMRQVLETAAAAGLPLMIFVGNRGCVQIHSGPVHRIEAMGPWLNVLDPRFNLHLRENRIAAAFVVRKPSARGDVHSLELFDPTGFCFAQVFGERPPGDTERADWRALVADLPEARPC